MVLSAGSKWGWRGARQAPSGLNIQLVPRKNMMEIAEADEQMIRCDETFHLLLSFGKRDSFFLYWRIVKTTTIRFPVMESNTHNYSWSRRKVVRRGGLVQGQLITKCYLLLNHPGNWRDGLFAFRCIPQGYERQRATVQQDCSVKPSTITSAHRLSLQHCILWMCNMLKFE